MNFTSDMIQLRDDIRHQVAAAAMRNVIQGPSEVFVDACAAACATKGFKRVAPMRSRRERAKGRIYCSLVSFRNVSQFLQPCGAYVLSDEGVSVSRLQRDPELTGASFFGSGGSGSWQEPFGCLVCRQLANQKCRAVKLGLSLAGKFTSLARSSTRLEAGTTIWCNCHAQSTLAHILLKNIHLSFRFPFK